MKRPIIFLLFAAASFALGCGGGGHGARPSGPDNGRPDVGQAPSAKRYSDLFAGLPPLSLPDENADADALKTYRDELAVRRQRVAALSGDVAAKAATLPSEVAAVFAFVRDHIEFLPYEGVLRGASGALMTGGGNSADQALLLHTLLQAKGIHARFAEGKLPTGQRPELGAVPVAAPTQNAALSALVGEVKAEQERLLTALGGALPPSGQATTSERHIWVQVEQDAGWVDLDPSFRASKVGQRHTEATQTHDALPESWCHRVSFKVIVEQLFDGKLERKELLSSSHTSAELVGAQLAFANVPNVEGSPLSKEAHKVKQLMPALVVNGKFQTNLGFDLHGNTVTKAEFIKHFGNPAASKLAGATGALGALDATGGLGPQPAEQQPPQGELAAEWLEITVATPDGLSRTHRRAIVDRVGAEARVAQGAKALDPAHADMGEVLLSLRGYDELLVEPALLCGPKTIDTLLAHLEADARQKLDPKADPAYPPSLELAMLDCAIRRVGDLVTAHQLPEARYYRPSAAVLRRTARLKRGASGVSLVQGFDIVDSVFAVHHADTSRAQHHGLALGVAQTAAEDLAEQKLLAAAEAASVSSPPFKMASLTSSWRRLHGEAPNLVRIATPRDLEARAMPGALKTQIREALRDGWLVVARDDAGDGWWRIDPTTHTAVGMTNSGRGSSLVERAWNALYVGGANVTQTVLSFGAGNLGFFTLAVICILDAADLLGLPDIGSAVLGAAVCSKFSP